LLEWGWEKFAYYQEMSWAFSGAMLAFFVLSGALLCGALGWAATRALVSTGAAASLAAGRGHDWVADVLARGRSPPYRSDLPASAPLPPRDRRARPGGAGRAAAAAGRCQRQREVDRAACPRGAPRRGVRRGHRPAAAPVPARGG